MITFSTNSGLFYPIAGHPIKKKIDSYYPSDNDYVKSL